MTSPIRQHWVPKMYLRNFCAGGTSSEDTAFVYVYDKEADSQFCSSLSNILLAKHLYTIGAGLSDPLYVVEKTLSKIEGSASPIINQLLQGRAVHCNLNDRIYLSYFFATLILRNPSTRLAQERGFNLLSERVPFPLSGNKDSEEYIQQVKQAYDLYSELDEDGKHMVFVRSILDSASSVSACLRNRPWYLFHATEGCFVTSDRPVVVYHPNERTYGVGTPGVQIHIAISPKLVLWIGCEVRFDEDKVHDIPIKLVDHVNYFTCRHADRFIVSSREFNDMETKIFKAGK